MRNRLASICVLCLNSALLAQEKEPLNSRPAAVEKQARSALVTPTNYQSTHANLRWAMQHFREMYPTQAVYCGNAPISQLPVRKADLLSLRVELADGQSTTIAQALRELEVDALVVLYRGNLIAEHYFNNMCEATPHFLASVNKSIVSSVIATLLADGTLAEDRSVESYVPELANTAYAGANIRQVLDMLSGVEYRYDGDEPTFKAHELSILPEAAFLKVPIGERNFIRSLPAHPESKHGERMLYKESDPGVLVWVAEHVTGKRFADLTQERLWSPLGAEYPLEVVCDSLGHWTFHISVTARDLAKWGQMLVQDGNFNGRQILPESFVQDIRSQGSVTRLRNAPLTGDFFPEGIGYRSFFYRDTHGHNAVAAAGAFGQMVYTSSHDDTVIVLFSSTDSWDEQLAAGRAFEDIFAEDVAVELMRWKLCRQICMHLSGHSN